MLSHKDLVDYLYYDISNGNFYWKKSIGSRVKAGDIAGSSKSSPYIRIQLFGKQYLAHRLAWFYCFKRWPVLDLDHINCIKTDNRLINLREATRSENRLNIPLFKNNSTGCRGVTWNKRDRVYKVAFRLAGGYIYLGRYRSLNSAVEVATKFIRENHKHFKYKGINKC